MGRPLLIIVSGAPSSGKTSLGRKIAKNFQLPFIFKDGIKEMLFNTLGWSDKEWTEKLNLATYGVMYHFIETQLEAGLSFVVEADFKPEEQTGQLQALEKRFQFVPFQVFCTARKEVLLDRFKERLDSHKRHPGHKDKENFPDFKDDVLKEEYGLLEIGGGKYTVDTTDFEKIDYSRLFAALNRAFE